MSSFPARTVGVVPRGVLKRGSYRLLVWSGLGSKAAARYAAKPWVDQKLVVPAPTKRLMRRIR
jgi:hypothetical protein